MKFRALFLASILALTAATPIARGEDQIAKIAIAYDIGFLGDNGFNDAIHRGLTLAKKKYKLAEPLVREVPTSGTTLDRLTRLRFLAKSGYTLIIAVGDGYRDTLKRASREYPTVQFAIVNDRSISPLNISNIYFDEIQSARLAGAAAALKSKGKSIAIIDADQSLADAFQAGAKQVRPSIEVRSIQFSGNIAQLDKELGRSDVIYSLWDKDAAIYKLVSARVPKSSYIARLPDQYFVSAGIGSSQVAAVIRKDYGKPVADLIEAALANSAVIDILDESGIYGREYTIANGAISIELDKSFSKSARNKIAGLVAELKKSTNQD